MRIQSFRDELFFFSSRRRHTRFKCDWSSDVCSSDLPGAIATVARVRGSTPVPSGTKMLVGAAGRLIGTVGGGCVEADVIAAALEAQARCRPALVTHHLNADLAGDLGLSCGGTVDIFVEPLVAD